MGLLGKGLEFSGSNRSQVRVNCPFCQKRGKATADTGKHLYIGVNNNKFICFRCDITGDNITSVIPELKYSTEFTNKNFTELFKKDKKVYFNLEEYGEEIKSGDDCHWYLHERGYGLTEIKKYNILKGTGEYRNRILIPNFELGSGKCDYFIARTIKSNIFPKYKNPPSKRISVLFNYHRAFTKDLAIMVEGWFTGACFGDNFLAYLGTSITLFQALKASEIKEVFYCPDGDVSIEKIIDNMKMLLLYRRNVKLMAIPRIPKFDAADMSLEHKRLSFKNTRTFSMKDLILPSKKDKGRYTRDLEKKSKDIEAWYESLFPVKELEFNR
jgi:hypothetical protein